MHAQPIRPRQKQIATNKTAAQLHHWLTGELEKIATWNVCEYVPVINTNLTCNKHKVKIQAQNSQ